MKIEIQFDEETRQFVKRIKARQPTAPPELHKSLGEHSIFAGDRIIVITSEQLTAAGWRRH